VEDLDARFGARFGEPVLDLGGELDEIGVLFRFDEVHRLRRLRRDPAASPQRPHSPDPLGGPHCGLVGVVGGFRGEPPRRWFGGARCLRERGGVDVVLPR
jgi:hypothetical protein